MLENGRGTLSTHASDQVHDFIRLSYPSRQGIIEKVVEFSESGMSHSWIARELNVTEGWVKRALSRNKKIFDTLTDAPSLQEKCATRARNGAAPYGFEIFDCRLVENPRELRVLRRIITLWNSGLGQKAIAAELNRLKLLTRKGKRWDHSVIGAIISRAQNRVAPYDQFAANLRPFMARKSPMLCKIKKKENEKPNQNNP